MGQRWKLMRTVRLLTGTDNGGEMQLLGAGTERLISVSVGLSNSVVETDYIFHRQKLVRVQITRTFFALGKNGIDFTKPRRIENGRYALSDGKQVRHFTGARDMSGVWEHKPTLTDKMETAREIENARFYLRIAASERQEADVEKRIKD